MAVHEEDSDDLKQWEALLQAMQQCSNAAMQQ